MEFEDSEDEVELGSDVEDDDSFKADSQSEIEVDSESEDEMPNKRGRESCKTSSATSAKRPSCSNTSGPSKKKKKKKQTGLDAFFKEK